MFGIQDDQTPTIRQRARGRSAGPRVHALAQKMLARLLRQPLDLVEADDHKLRIVRERERVQRFIPAHTREIPQPERTQLVLPPFVRRWEDCFIHVMNYTLPVPVAFNLCRPARPYPLQIVNYFLNLIVGKRFAPLWQSMYSIRLASESQFH